MHEYRRRACTLLLSDYYYVCNVLNTANNIYILGGISIELLGLSECNN